jgi:hypothetical protein
MINLFLDNGKLVLEEVIDIIRTSMDENELYFTEEEINKLANVLFKVFDTDNSQSIDFDEFYNHLQTRSGLIGNLWINVENWFLPKPEKEKRFRVKDLVPQCMKWSHIRNNLVNVTFFLSFVAINFVLFYTRALDFYNPIEPNNYYMIARASGLINFIQKTKF